MSDEQLHEQIEDYLRGLMPEEEEAAFQARMEADPALAAAVNKHRAALIALQLSAEAAMREKIAKWDKKHFEGNTTQEQNPGAQKPLIMLPWLKWGSILTAVVLLVYFLTRPPDKPLEAPAQPNLISPPPAPAVQNEQPAKEELPKPAPEPEPRRLTAIAIVKDASKPFRGGGGLRNNNQGSKPDTMATAITLLQNKQENEALKILNACRSCKALDAAQWRGHAYFRLGSFESAIKEFTFWKKNGYSEAGPQWYLFLATYANNKMPEDIYRNSLNALKDPSHPYHRDFLELTQKLKDAGYSVD